MKIFRKIRLKTIDNKDFKKYIVYASGEIILVVIGILIALYINNKKEFSDAQQTQRNHLILIKEELKNNLIVLEDEEEVLSDLISNLQELSYLIYSEEALKKISESNLSSLLFLPVSRSIEVNYENAAYKEFINSNNLKDIKNDSIRTILRSWERRIETIKLQEKAVQNSLSKTVDFMEINGSLKTIFDDFEVSEDYLGIKNSVKKYSNKSTLKSKQLENILLQYLGVAIQLSKKDYPSFRNDMIRLIHLIEKNLKEN
jgi:hypothetical protein